MRRHRVVALSCVVLSFALAVTATTSITSVTAERDTSVDIAGESNAYLVVDTDDETVTSEDETDVELGEIRNNFEAPVTDIDISLTSDGVGLPSFSDVELSTGDSLDSGGDGDIEATGDCGGDPLDRETMTVGVETSGPDPSVSASTARWPESP